MGIGYWAGRARPLASARKWARWQILYPESRGKAMAAKVLRADYVVLEYIHRRRGDDDRPAG
jgi:hypothetical protein